MVNVQHRMARPVVTGVSAIVLFNILFAGPLVDFWYQLSATVFVCCAAAALLDVTLMRRLLRATTLTAIVWTAVGALLSAAALYGVFWLGDIIARSVLPFAASGIDAVYAFKSGAQLKIVLLIVLIIGPGEEIFWRGYLQHALTKRYPLGGIIVTILAYMLAHLASANPMLIVASLVCGAFWSLLYAWRRSLWLNIISHVVWDLAAFIFWPFS